jgi:HAD superfamily hydrolase (TIGR01509 family)
MEPGIELVIFDCDGVLVDSEPIAQEVLSLVLQDIGIMLSPTQVGARFFGKTVPQCIEIIEDMLGDPLSADFVAVWRKCLYARFREAPVRAAAGIHEALRLIRVPICVASNGPLEKMHTTLGVTGLLPHFDGKLFSPDLGIAGKPAPDLFLAAAAAHAVAPARCAVIEDSPGGIRAARAAGMRAFGYTGLPHADVDALAAAGAQLFSDMLELPALLES